MRTETELNEALARFSGWRKADLGWTSGDNYFYIEPPDFCHSVDACVKWLGPMFMDWTLRKNSATRQYEVQVCSLTQEGNANSDTSALAFARAAEKAMDAEKGVGGK